MDGGTIYTSPTSMEPLFPERGALEDRVLEVVREAAALGGALHPMTRRRVVEMLRTINSYYSNLIEGHGTHPYDIERAMEGDYSEEPAERALQQEGRAHVEVDRLVEERLDADTAANPCAASFLRWIHAEFYGRMPDELRRVDGVSSTDTLPVEPGALRDREVVAGRHVAPSHEALSAFLDRFAEAYRPDRLGEIERVLAFAASHHRLLWIHPFLDGNGRVARLFSGAYAQRAELGGHGLWTVSRGLARDRSAYMRALAGADADREDEYDGRGNLSRRGLTAFCRYFLDTCLDQIRYMGSVLDLEGLEDRVEGYVHLRSEGMIPGRRELRVEAKHLLVEVLRGGELRRGEAGRVTGLHPRTARDVVSGLVEEGLLWSKTPKGALRLGLPMHAVEYWFPRLFPEKGVGAS